MLKVVVLSGFLGSGKTTLVKNILTNTQSKRVAIILNDISEFDIDTDFVQKKSMQIQKKADIVQISNGCVCCTLKDDMIKEVKKIAKSKKFDYLVIQATGVSTPLPIAQAFAYTEGINKITEVLGMITVVDAQNFEKNLLSNELVEGQEKQNTGRGRKNKKIKQKEEEDEKPTLAQLMIDQLQIADLVLINKTDLVSKKTLKQVQLYVKGLNPHSQVLTSSYSNVDLDQIFKKRFDLEKAQLCLKWIGEREKTQDIPQTIKYNISSFIYRSRRPFDPNKIHALINSQKYWPFWNSITRAKGFFWLANYPRFEFSIQKAGMRVVYAIEQPWYCQMPKTKWAPSKKQLKQVEDLLKKYFQAPWGDKRNQIVFISKDMKRQQIQEELNNCLIPQSFLQKYQQSYSMIDDPFQNQWKQAISFFQKNDLLLQNQGDWEQMDEEQDESESYKP